MLRRKTGAHTDGRMTDYLNMQGRIEPERGDDGARTGLTGGMRWRLVRRIETVSWADAGMGHFPGLQEILA